MNAKFIKTASKSEIEQAHTVDNLIIGRFVCPYCDKNVAFLESKKSDTLGIEHRQFLEVQIDQAFTDSSTPNHRGGFVRVENWRRFNETWKAKTESRAIHQLSYEMEKDPDLQDSAGNIRQHSTQLMNRTAKENVFGPNRLTIEDFDQRQITVNCCGRPFEIEKKQILKWEPK